MGTGTVTRANGSPESRREGTTPDGATRTKPKLIASDIAPQAFTTPKDPIVTDKVEELVHSGYVIVQSPETASTLWLAATRTHPESSISLTRVSAGYRLEMAGRRFV